jgi:hypothetical protein
MSNQKEKPPSPLDLAIKRGTEAVRGKTQEQYGGYAIKELESGNIAFQALEKRPNGSFIAIHHTLVPRADVPKVIEALQKIIGVHT